MANVLLKEGEWLPVANNKWTVDGRNIPEEVFESIMKNKATGHIPYWTIGHQRGNDIPRVGNIDDFKYESGELFVKSSNMDKEFMKAVEEGKYPHLSIEIYPLFEGKETITNETGDNEEVEAWGWMFNGVAAISRNAAFPQYHLIQFGREDEQLFMPDGIQFPVEVGTETIRVRVRMPDDFEKSSFRTIDIDKEKGIKSVIGRLKETQKTASQNFMFTIAKDWTEAKAVKWVKDHGYSILERSYEKFDIFVANIFNNKKGVNDFMEDTKDKVEIKEVAEVKIEMENIVEDKQNDIIEEPKKKVGRPKKEESHYGADYRMKQSYEYEREIEEKDKIIKRLREDLTEKDKLNQEKDKRLETAHNTIMEQDFIIQAEYFMAQNKINYNDLQIPETVRIEKPTDYIEFSPLFEKWKNPETRELLLSQWKVKAPVELESRPLGAKMISYEERQAYTDEDLVKMETKAICKEKGISVYSNEGDQIAMQIELKHKEMPWKLKKKYGVQ